ncbi:uncharacterized protein YodC (DUF2158 family) [Nitrospirillum amazonense]|uniref:Uncharacterized protein YodC (DUF2158 family) n=1 Tax=Nitrospirillum amazonense TaxID=28077 RepID=A0A560F0B0_9PROT|nr:DUF2158 domain-containing protein [Nitrospirillum amazonense]TWB15061.1 uncharacterized protein YodC (DUF2158 family) [Nitrospirillum amazonense]
MEDNFNLGDVVRLKSGGPVMTVISAGTMYSGEKYTSTVWFLDGTVQKYDFHPAVLELAIL